MNTKTAPESCPFCGAGKKRHLPHIAFQWFECGTMTAPSKTPRRDQTPACATAEREGLIRERDEARAERDDLLARVKRLEEALSFVTVDCGNLHHGKKHRHKYGEPCPVVELIEKAKEAKP